MHREEIQAAFVRLYSAPRMKALEPVTEAALSDVEGLLRTTFPHSYVAFITRYGPLFTPDILHRLVDAREGGRPAPDGFEVQEFFSPSEIVETYRLYVGGGMEDSVIPIAMDSGGSVFGFRRMDRSEKPDDLPVLFFDHDFCVVRAAADSFDDWLRSYLVLAV